MNRRSQEIVVDANAQTGVPNEIIPVTALDIGATEQRMDFGDVPFIVETVDGLLASATRL